MNFLAKRLAALEKDEGAGKLELSFVICSDEVGPDGITRTVPEIISRNGETFDRKVGETGHDFRKRAGLKDDGITVRIGGEDPSDG